MSDTRFNTIEIVKHNAIDDEGTQETLWALYQRAFQSINEDTPISQTLPRRDFMSWMTNARVAKHVARGGGQ